MRRGHWGLLRMMGRGGRGRRGSWLDDFDDMKITVPKAHTWNAGYKPRGLGIENPIHQVFSLWYCALNPKSGDKRATSLIVNVM
jgi:hypothetical protein